MSGHSKWSTIKRKKGETDSARGAVFTKSAKEIMLAVKQGGVDPASNSRLRDVISKAKANNMPNDNINRAIKKAASAGEGDDYEEIIYEGYGAGGVAVMVRTLTNNRNRTAGDVRHLFDKHGGNMGVAGSVSFLFQEKGIIVIDAAEFENEETVMMDALEAGAEDFTSEEGYYEIVTVPHDYYTVKDALAAKGYTFADSNLGPVPITWTEVEDVEMTENLEKMLEKMEENEDIQEVYNNWHN